MLMINTLSEPEALISRPSRLAGQAALNVEAADHKVLLISCGMLLEDAIAGLLETEQDLRISIVPAGDENVIANAIRMESPDTIIFCKSRRFSVQRLSQMLEQLDYSHPVQIIVISINGNTLEIFNQRRLVATNFGNFVELIKSNHRALQ